jgi:hypothetical protein
VPAVKLKQMVKPLYLGLNVEWPFKARCCLFQGKLRVYARGDTGYTFGAIAILVRLPSDGPQVYRSARSVPLLQAANLRA